MVSIAAKGGIILQSSRLQISSDGKTLCTSQLQQAIDRMAKKGRGTLVLAQNAQHIAIENEGVIDGNGLQLALNADSLHHTGNWWMAIITFVANAQVSWCVRSCFSLQVVMM